MVPRAGIIKSLLVLLLIALVLSFVPVYASAAGDVLPSGVEREELGDKIEAFVDEHSATTAGMAVAVFDSEGDIYRNHFGYIDMEKGLPVDESSVFEWGSATKLLVWVSVMQLWEQGKIDLDADVRDYLPEGFLTNLSFDRPVTMTNLMCHNAGFQEMLFDVFVRDTSDIKPLGEALKARMPAQIYEPGTVTAYSNWGVALAGYIVELISGQEFYTYVRENIFEPLGMAHSALAPDLGDNPWVAEQRDALQCYTAGGELIPNCKYHIPIYPAGSCVSTLEDFSRFAAALLEENTPLFASDKTRDFMLTPTSLCGESEIPCNCHGFWAIAFKDMTLGHGGNTAGCSSYLLIQPETGVGAVVMTNQQNEEVYNFEMMELIFGAFDEAEFFGGERELPEGIYRSSRTVRRGVLKLYSLGALTFEDSDRADFWVWDRGSGKVCCPYADFLPLNIGSFVFEVGITGLWIASAVFSLIYLIAALIRRMLKKPPAPTGGWRTASALAQLLVLPPLVLAVVSAMTYRLAASYIWTFAVIGVLALAMLALTVLGITKLRGAELSKKGRVLNIFILLALVLSVINICYWNIFMFWTV